MKRFGLRWVAVMLGALALLGLVIAPAQAVTFTWNFSSPPGSVGPTHTYPDTSNTISIPAAGFVTQNAAPTSGIWNPGGLTPTPLFGKVTSGDPSETGLGLTNFVDSEIAVSTMIQLDLQNLINANLINLVLGIGSIQTGERFAVFGSNTAGAPGTFLCGGTGGAVIQTCSEPTIPFRFDYVTANIANVLLLDGATAQKAPEPSTLLLLGSGLLGLGGMVWRRNRK